MSEERDLMLAFFGGAPVQNPDTPGYHVMNLGGSVGPFGPPVSLCAHCGALVGDTDEIRAAHTAFHQGLVEIAQRHIEREGGSSE